MVVMCGESYGVCGGLNYIVVVVDDLDVIENCIKKSGYVIKNYGDYEFGCCFYFDDDDGIEFEVVSYWD